MNTFTKNVEIRWSDLDPNFHLRHSVYYDWGAYLRMQFFTSNGFSMQYFQQHHFGPIIFREECIFRKEILFTDSVSISIAIQKAKPDFSRCTIQHFIMKNQDQLAATLQVDLAFMHTQLRKLTLPPQDIINLMSAAPRTPDFSWMD